MRSALLLAAASAFWSLPGCSDGQIPTYPVSGKVLFADGQPVRTGTIEFESVEHPLSAAGRIQDDGTFVLGTYTRDDGAAAGQHRVIVVQMVISDGLTRHQKDHGRVVDPKFRNYESSGLTAAVEPRDANSLTIELAP